MKLKIDSSGKSLDAKIDVAFEGQETLVTVHARGGASGARPGTNPDYEAAVQLLLERLAAVGCELRDVRLASSRVAHLPIDERRLTLDSAFPIMLHTVPSITTLRYEIRRAVFGANNRSGKAGHGNATKKIQLVFGSDASISKLAQTIEWGPAGEQVVDDTELTSFEKTGFSEGSLVYRSHLERERNKTIVALAKREFRLQHGRLFCEVCGFDFEAFYGEMGTGYIEAHHELPISELSQEVLTLVSDLRMVCSNCHRMLHRNRPWPSVDELKQALHAEKS